MMRRKKAAEAFATSSADLDDATSGEEMELLAASGVTVIMLAAALGGPTAMKGIEPSHPPDQGTIERIRARIRCRRRLGLPHRDCLKRDCDCASLAAASASSAVDLTQDRKKRIVSTVT